MSIMQAYSVLEIKSVNEDKRIFAGTATNPSVDRYGDIVEPKGAEFKLPIPFLWQHDSRQPVGHVTKATVTNAGIDVEVQLVKTSEPGNLKDRLDEAWQSIKLGLVRGLSIGFKSIESAKIDGTFGIRFIKWAWVELSGVTLPANADCTIQMIKSIDTAARAATGNKRGVVVRLNPPGDSGSKKLNKLPMEGTEVKTITEQIAEWEAKRAAKSAKQTEIMNKSAESGSTLDAADAEEYDALAEELKQIDKHLERLGDMQKQMQSTAKAVKAADAEEASRSREVGRVQVLEPKLEKGIGFARYAMCVGAAHGNIMLAQQIAKSRYPEFAPLQEIMKAAVAAGTTADSTWASPLVQYQILATEFVEYLRPQTIIGKFGANGIPSLRRVPFKVKIPRQTSKSAAYWVGEGKPKPLSKYAMDTVTLDFSKVATIAVLTEELIRFSSPSAEMLVRDELAAAVIERIDIDFIDPAKAVSANVSPASITNGVTAVVSTGDLAANVRTDIANVFAIFIQNNMPVQNAVWIMNANVALALSLMRTELSAPEFPGVGMNGGTFQGLPVIVSQYVPTAIVILVSAGEIYLADDGNVTIDASREASLEMLDGGSSQDAGSGTGASLVSMFQTNSVAIRAEREINWAKRRSGAVEYISSANWGGTAGSGDI